MIPMSIVGFFFYKKRKKEVIRKKKDELERQFRDCILSVAASIKAGYAVENAFKECESDMAMMYGDKSAIVTELSLIRRGLISNVPLEDLLNNLAERSGIASIKQFSEVFAIAKRGGGNMAEIMNSTAGLISGQVDLRAEISSVLSGRKMEQNIMKLMPFAIVLYIGITSAGYFDSLYGNIQGVFIMSGCLGIYILSYFLGEKILLRLEREM